MWYEGLFLWHIYSYVDGGRFFRSVCVCSGLGGSESSGTARSKCAPGKCFLQTMCLPAQGGGFECAPCPDGYTGDGINCDDVDEVGVCVFVCLFALCTHILEDLSFFSTCVCVCALVCVLQCQFNPCFPGVRCVNTVPGFNCERCPLGYTGSEINGVGVAYAQANKQVQYTPTC